MEPQDHSKNVTKQIHFLNTFWAILGPILGSILGSTKSTNDFCPAQKVWFSTGKTRLFAKKMRILWKCWHACDSIFDPISKPFLTNFGTHFGPQMDPKTGPKNWSFRSIFEPVFSGLKGLQVPLESHLDRHVLVLRAPRTQKEWFSYMKKHTFCKCCFSVLWGSWSPSWAHLGTSLPILSPKWAPKWTQN